MTNVYGEFDVGKKIFVIPYIAHQRCDGGVRAQDIVGDLLKLWMMIENDEITIQHYNAIIDETY